MIRSRPLAIALICSLFCAAPLMATDAAGATQQPAPASAASSSTVPASNVWYEIFVRSWYDTNGDGIGDINGVTAKLDYLQKLGISGIWLMPISPSPSYHGYDVTDYEGINPQYGSMADFEHLLSEAHKRGIKVIIDLVANHSSSQNPWFIAAQNPKNPKHDWYQWATRKTDTTVISATDSPAWHTNAQGKKYMGVFTADMPDLDYDNPAVRQAMIKIGQFWLKKGIDGFRLDAAQHIYYDYKWQDGNAAVLEKNLAWWQQFRQGMNQVDPNAYIIGEVTQQTPKALAPWFGPLSAVFDFPLAEQLIASARSERDDGLGALLDRTTAAYHQASSGKPAMDAPFLTNHDQQRVMSQLDDNVAHMRMAAAMLLTLPGDPFIYYGEELGMRGSKPDPDLREPMRWYRDPHGEGQTTWKAFTAGDGPAISVQAQSGRPGSMLSHYRTLIDWRAQISALRDGVAHSRATGQPHVVAWELVDPSARVLVLHNLSGAAQKIDLDTPALQPFSNLIKHTAADAAIHGQTLTLPPYSSALLD